MGTAPSTGGASKKDQNCSEALACTFIACDEKGNPVETDIRFSTAVKWTTTGASGTYDIQSVAAHEIGHVLQFDHVTNSSKDDHTVLMWPYMDSADTSGRKLGRGDAIGEQQPLLSTCAIASWMSRRAGSRT